VDKLEAMMARLKRILFYCIRSIGGFAIAQRLTRTRLRILCYHGFSITDEHELAPYVFMRVETFARRMRILHERGVTVVSLDEAIKRLRAGTITNCETVITFDDGWASNLLIMPILERYHFPACIYITTEHLNAGTEAFNVILTQMVQRSRVASLALRNIHPQIDGEYDLARDPAAAAVLLIIAAERIESLQERQGLLAPLAEALGLDYAAFVANGRFRFVSKEQIADLANKGVSIELHTHTHHLPSTNFDEMAGEIRQNRAAITELTGIEPKHFCYPSGEHSPWHPDWLARAGIASATTCDSGFNDSNTSLLLLSRYLDSENASDIEFEAEITGVSELLRRMRSGLSRVLRR
jgi:peptidoglycan/xylan/chitin deacetylase (PgdA/CDA1 family)